MLISNWRDVMARSWSLWCAYLGLVLPEVVDLGMRWLYQDGAAGLSPQAKDFMCMVMLVLVIVTRLLRQKSMQPPPIQPLK